MPQTKGKTRLVVVETISNPLLRVADIAALAEIAHRAGALLLVDNTFAGPTICRPLELGTDLVLESLTKSMNGHSDVVLGLLCGKSPHWQRVPTVLSAWGFSAAPLDCWLTLRGLGTLALRAQRSMDNALAVAKFLEVRRATRGTGPGRITQVYYPGLPQHIDHTLARRQFGERFGSVVSLTLAGGREAAVAFMQAAPGIPFCPSLGELCTTLTHPESTSHRTISRQERDAQGITGGTLRLSIGIESPESILASLTAGFDAAERCD